MNQDEGGGQLPHNLEIERALLGAILRDNDILFEVIEEVDKADYFEPWNGELYILCRDQIESRRGITARLALADINQDADVGGIRASEVIAICEREGQRVSRLVAIELAKQIRELARRRLMIAASRRNIVECMSSPVSVTALEIREHLDADLAAIFPSLADQGIRLLGDVAGELVEEAKDENREAPGLSLGLSSIQDLTGLLKAGHVLVLGGASGSGKTAAAKQIGRWVSRPQVDPSDQRIALMIELEMDTRELAAQSLAADTGISGSMIEDGKLNREEYTALFDAQMKMAGETFFIESSGEATTFQKIRTKALRMKRLRGLHLLIIDHLLLIERENWRSTEVEAVGPHMRGLKRLARELQIPIIILAQLKGDYQDGPVRRPRVRDLYNHTAVEQNSDFILFVHRAEYLLRRNPPAPEAGETEKQKWNSAVDRWEGRAEFILGKRRLGKGFGIRECEFNANRVLFYDNRGEAWKDETAFDFGS